MARPRASKPRKSRGSENLTSLSEEVLRLRFQALNLPITGSKAVLVCRFKAATHSRKGITSRPSKTQALARANTSTRSTGEPHLPTMSSRNLRPFKPLRLFYRVRDSEEEPMETYSDLDDPLVEDFEEATHNTGNSFTPAQLATIESTVQSSVDHALKSFSISGNLPFLGATPPYSGTQPRRAGTVTPLGLHRPLDRSLEDKILLAHTPNRVSVRQPTTRVASLKDPCASSSTDQVAVPHVPVLSRTCAAADVPPTTLSSPAPPVSHRTAQGPTGVPAPATVVNDKVRLLARNILLPPRIHPIKGAILERELSHHPNRDFSNSLINALRFGTHVGYTGPEKYRVSRNLISAVQHPEVVSSNLTKQISLGRIAEPFPSPLLSHMQCHPLGVSLKNIPQIGAPFILSGGGQY